MLAGLHWIVRRGSCVLTVRKQECLPPRQVAWYSQGSSLGLPLDSVSLVPSELRFLHEM